jgi:hypothetical protein
MPAYIGEIRILAGGRFQIMGSGNPESSGPVQTPVPDIQLSATDVERHHPVWVMPADPSHAEVGGP